MLNFTHMLKSFFIYLCVCGSQNWVLDKSLSACTKKFCSRRVSFSIFFRNHCAFFLSCIHLPLKLPTKFDPCAMISQIYGYWIEFWFRSFPDFYSSLCTDHLNPEVPKYRKQREFFQYFQLEQKQLVQDISSFSVVNSDLFRSNLALIPIGLLKIPTQLPRSGTACFHFRTSASSFISTSALCSV